MESSNFYELLHQQLGSFSSLAAQSMPGVAPIHEENPSLLMNINGFNRYMNEILPNSTNNANFPDMGYDEYESCPNQSTMLNAVDLNQNQNLWLSTTSNWACQDASSSNNHVFNSITIGSANLGLSSTSSLDSSHLAMNFTANNGVNHPRSSKEDSSLCIHLNDSSYGQPSNSNKTSESRDRTISRTKRVISTSSQRKPSQDEAAKKQKAASQAPCSLPKVGKEKIGDRIAALHRLVAPFGKTDAASVLTEAIGYIQFLQHQIQTLSMPCIKPSLSDCHHFQRVASKVEHKQDLRSRGLYLVPSPIASYISSSFVGLDNNID